MPTPFKYDVAETEDSDTNWISPGESARIEFPVSGQFESYPPDGYIHQLYDFRVKEFFEYSKDSSPPKYKHVSFKSTLAYDALSVTAPRDTSKVKISEVKDEYGGNEKVVQHLSFILGPSGTIRFGYHKLTGSPLCDENGKILCDMSGNILCDDGPCS